MNKALKVIAGLVSLSLVLLYNFVHTGNVLAAFVDPQWVGYAAAFGIESIVIFLSAQISERRKTGRDTNLFVSALVAVVVVSAFANIAQGYLVKFGKPLEMSVFGLTDFAQLVVWLSSTGLLSLVTFAMAEIIGDDITASKAQPVAQALATDAQPEQVPSSGETDAPNSVTVEDTGYNATQSSQNATSSAVVVENDESTTVSSGVPQIAVFERDKVTTADIILEYYRRNPDATLTQAAQHVARATGTTYSRQAISSQLKRLEADGKVARNGHVEVLP